MPYQFPSKIILFGEYTIIQNSEALAIPFLKYSAKWSFEQNQDSKKMQSIQHLSKMLSFLSPSDYRVEEFQQDLEKGLWLDSNIPLGYGLGSSGSVCAALYKKYRKIHSTAIPDLKRELSELEHFFHGESSGIDPLISYTRKALWIKEKNNIEPIQLKQYSSSQLSFFLLDTEIERKTSGLVPYFKKQCLNPTFVNGPLKELKTLTRESIKYTIEQKHQNLFSHTQRIAEIQFDNFSPMIPSNIHSIWAEGLSSTNHCFKLCGAGGGGYILGLTKNWKTTKILYPNAECILQV